MKNFDMTDYLQKAYRRMSDSRRFIVSNLNMHNCAKAKVLSAAIQSTQRYKSYSATYYLYALGLIQIALIHYVLVVPFQVTVINLTLFSAAYFLSMPLARHLNTPGLIHSWATWTFGGIGMLLGHKLDSYLSSSAAHLHHHTTITTTVSAAEIYSFLFSGMTLLMLFFCVPACVYLCNAKLTSQSNLRKCLLHLTSGFSMLLGMFLAMRTEQYLFANITDVNSASYYFMLILMVMFSSSTYYLVFEAVNRMPNASAF